MILISEGAR